MLSMRAETQSSSDPNLWQGLLAGASGGLIASFAMDEFCSRVLSAKSNSEPGKEDSTIKLASGISEIFCNHVLTPDQKTIGSDPRLLERRVKPGGCPSESQYGSVRTYHRTRTPSSQPITRNAAGSQAVEGAAHLIYGAVVEGLRRSMRGPPLR